MAVCGSPLEDLAWSLSAYVPRLVCCNTQDNLFLPSAVTTGEIDKVRLEDLSREGVACADGFATNTVFHALSRSARLLGAHPQGAFLGAVASGLLLGALPEGHTKRNSLPDSFFGPAGGSPSPGQSCLEADDPVHRSWVAEADSASEFRALVVLFDAVVVSLRELVCAGTSHATSISSVATTNPVTLSDSTLEAARPVRSVFFRDNVMVARYSGDAPESLELPFDSDPVLRSRHHDWQGDAVLSAVLVISSGQNSKMVVSWQGEERCVELVPNRAFLCWSGCTVVRGPSLLVVIRYFDGKLSMQSAPGIEHLYRHCNPVGLSRRAALSTCFQDVHQARRLELIHEFYEVRGGDRTDTLGLKMWLAQNHCCAQCGRADASCGSEHGEEWYCSPCGRIWHQATRLEVREDGAVYSGLLVNDIERQTVRDTMQEGQWFMEFRHGALAAPELVGLRPCPLSSLGECGDSTCTTHCSVTPGARPWFLRHAVRHIEQEFALSDGVALTFIGSGQLYFEFLLVDELLRAIPVREAHLVDLKYGVAQEIAERAAVAQFAAWFSQVRTYMHTSVDEWSYRVTESCCCAHAVVMVDVAGLMENWKDALGRTIRGALPPGSLFMHLTQGRDESPGTRVALFAWSEVHRLQGAEFQRVERRDWMVGATGPGTVTF